MLHNREVEIRPAGNELEFTFGRLFLWKNERKKGRPTQNHHRMKEKEAELMNLIFERLVGGKLSFSLIYVLSLSLPNLAAKSQFSSFDPAD